VNPDRGRQKGLSACLLGPGTGCEEAVQLLKRPRVPRQLPLADRLLELPLVRLLFAHVLRRQVAAKARPDHYPAPYALIELWKRSSGRPEALEQEARSFARLIFTPTAQNLVRVFFLQDRLKDIGKVATVEYRHVHVIGAGTMGADIAAWCAIRGLAVTLQDRDNTYVAAGLDRAGLNVPRKVKTD